MQDKSLLGTRYVCFECGCKFYDLNREEAICPDCDQNQEGAPSQDISSMLSGPGRRTRRAKPVVEEEKTEDLDLEDGLDFNEEEEEEEENLPEA